MKRRSPWLAFAACALLNGPLLANPTDNTGRKPALTICKAANAAETELEKRGLAKDHSVVSVALISDQGATPHYVARIQPPVFTPIANASKEEPVTPASQRSLVFYIAMDGQVTAKEEDSIPRRIRVINSNSN